MDVYVAIKIVLAAINDNESNEAFYRGLGGMKNEKY